MNNQTGEFANEKDYLEKFFDPEQAEKMIVEEMGRINMAVEEWKESAEQVRASCRKLKNLCESMIKELDAKVVSGRVTPKDE